MIDLDLIARRWASGGRLSGPGIVPVGEEVLHRPTVLVGSVSPDVLRLIAHMERLIVARGGVGLAANQVGVPLRLFIHRLSGAAPSVIINPRVLRSTGDSVRPEGCLSLKLAGTHTLVRRPARVLIEADSLDGGTVSIDAGGYLARVFQHEIDHLDGIEYVQRLEGGERVRAYDSMARAQIDTSLMPPRPYSGAAAFVRAPTVGGRDFGQLSHGFGSGFG